MQQGDNMMETADMTMNGCSLSGPGGAMENSTTHKNTHTHKIGTDLHFPRQLSTNFEEHVVGQNKGSRLVLSPGNLVSPGVHFLNNSRQT